MQQSNDDQKDEYVISKRCKKEKGRNLCLYSSIEYKPQSKLNSSSNNFSLSLINDANYDYIKKKYFTNMYTLSKWSKFIRHLYHNDTLDKFCNRMCDGTYILGLPASSESIENVLNAVNLLDDEIISPYQGKVNWIIFRNIIDVDIANFLQIEDLMAKCIQVLRKTFSGKVGYVCYLRKGNIDYNRYDSNKFWGSYSKWNIRIAAVRDLKNKQSAIGLGRYLLMLINYMEHKSFDWITIKFDTKNSIQRILMAFLSIDLKLLPVDKKTELFRKYVKPDDYAYMLFFQLIFMTFGPNGPTVLAD